MPVTPPSGAITMLVSVVGAATAVAISVANTTLAGAAAAREVLAVDVGGDGVVVLEARRTGAEAVTLL